MTHWNDKVTFKQKLNLAIFLVSCAFCTIVSASAPPRVVFLSPDPDSGSGFWHEFGRFMQAVSHDLNIDFEIVHSKSNSYSLKKDGMAIVNERNKPDYFITGYWEGVTDKLIDKADERGIGFFLVNTVIDEQDRPKVKRPRTKYPYWLGHMAPDDLNAGYLLAEILIKKSQSLGNVSQDGKINLVGIIGEGESSVTYYRHKGLEQCVAEFDNVNLLKVISSLWSPISAKKTTEELLLEYPQTNIIWSISDGMANGVMQAVEVSDKTLGKDILTGGMDWTDHAMNAIRAGKMVGSIGGHFMEGGWALILLHDYYYGIDFADDLGVQITTPMQAITSSNVEEYISAFGDRDWDKIDFKKFSKKHNENLESYNFSLKAILDQVSK